MDITKKQKIQVAINDKETICCNIYGDTGRDMVLLHGNGEDKDIFEKFILQLKKTYRVIAIDSRMHGESQTSDKKLTIPLMANDIVVVCKQLNVKNAILVGFSDGGNVSLEMLAKHKQSYETMFSHLVLLGANAFPSGIKFCYRLLTLCAYAFFVCFSWCGKKFTTKAKQYRLMVKEPKFTTENFPKTSTKVLVMEGEKGMIKQSHTSWLAKLLQGNAMIIKDADHFLPQKNSEEIAQIIENFANA